MFHFQNYIDTPSNILPYQGEAFYYGKLFSSPEADKFMVELRTLVPWEHDIVQMFGKRIVTKRKVAWYGDREYTYKYSNTAKLALPWIPQLTCIKNAAENASQENYNSCLLNYYHKGDEGMGWHSDNEKELKPQGAIASISFGAERKFSFKHRETKETRSLLLEHGSLLVMKGEIQSHWLHSLPKTKKILNDRINLTFRTILEK